jgi:hypothetical protein
MKADAKALLHEIAEARDLIKLEKWEVACASSVGEDMRDDGGDSVPDAPRGESRDWVWPRLASGARQPGG